MKKTLFAIIFLLVATVAANANTLTVTPVVGNLYQQTVQSPCIFANPSCQQGNPAFPATDVPNQGNVATWDLLSPVYSGLTLNNIKGAGPLLLGLDVNQATGAGPQTLVRFEMLVNGVVVDTFVGPLSVPAGNNGNGYADFLIANFSTFANTATVQFRFVFADANDGAENVFVIAGGTTTPVPEPSSIMTMGFGLLLLAMTSRKLARRNR